MEFNFRLEVAWNQAAKRRVCVGLVLCNEKKKREKKEHLFRMEIQGLCWDKRALPQCGWVRMQGNNLVRLLFMQTYTTCVSSECQRIHRVNIKAWAELNKCQIFAVCRTVTQRCTLHISCNMTKEPLGFFPKKEAVQKSCKLWKTHGYVI